MLEELFTTSGDRSPVQFTRRGATHDEAPRSVPRADRQSWPRRSSRTPPVWIHRHEPILRTALTYGFAADLLRDMAIASLGGAAVVRSQRSEATFESQGRLEEKLARARGWTALPRRSGGAPARRSFRRVGRAKSSRDLCTRSRPAPHDRCQKTRPIAETPRLFVVPEAPPAGV